jgi:hypothetical protein
MHSIIAFALFAQVFNATQAYTTADAVNPDRLGLATLAGRYMLELGDGCEGLVAGMNVELIIGSDDTALISPACSITIGQRMSSVPCFTVDDVCDVAAEVDE